MKIICSSVIPQQGKYEAKDLTLQEFKNLVNSQNGNIEYHIGFKNTADLISEILKVDVPVSKERVYFDEPEDEAIAVILKPEFYDKHKKTIKQRKLKPENCIFRHIKYISTN